MAGGLFVLPKMHKITQNSLLKKHGIFYLTFSFPHHTRYSLHWQQPYDKIWCYHRLTRANTPASASFRRFLSFSPWRALARLRLKNQKSLEYPSLADADSFAGAEMRPDKERPVENTAVLSRDLTPYGRISARQNRVCPCQPMVESEGYHDPF